MPTELLYLDDTYLFTAESTITGVGDDERGAYVVCAHTIFYPQGGGQPSDTGHLAIDGMEVPVTFAGFVNGEVRHYIDAPDIAITAGAPVVMRIDRHKRLEHARTHTAGHLLSHIVEEMFDDVLPTNGFHFPGQARVEFRNENRHALSERLDEINAVLAAEIAADAPITTARATHAEIVALRPHLAPMIPKDKPLRTVQIGAHQPLPCGGTHPSRLAHLGGVTVTRAKNRKGMTKLYYEMAESPAPDAVT